MLKGSGDSRGWANGQAKRKGAKREGEREKEQRVKEKKRKGRLENNIGSPARRRHRKRSSGPGK